MKAEKEPPIDKHTNALGGVDPMPSLPAKGRKLGISTGLALEFAGVAAVAMGAAACVFPIFGSGETPSPNKTPIVTPSSSPTGTPEITIVPSPTAEVSPTLSPEAKLKQDMAAFLSPDTKLPDTGRFYLFEDSKTPALANALPMNGTVGTDYTRPFNEIWFQGYLIGTARVESTDGTEYLIAYMGQESAKSKNGTSERYILPVNLGRLDTTDRDYLGTDAGVVAYSPSGSQKFGPFSVSEMEDALNASSGNFVKFTLDVITGGYQQGYDDMRNPNEIRAQDAAAKAIIEFSKQTLTKPYDQVSQSTLVKGIVDETVNAIDFDPSSIPMAIDIIFS